MSAEKCPCCDSVVRSRGEKWIEYECGSVFSHILQRLPLCHELEITKELRRKLASAEAELKNALGCYDNLKKLHADTEAKLADALADAESWQKQADDRLNDALDKCPHCGAEQEIPFNVYGYKCGTDHTGAITTDLCHERTAHAETRQQYMELIMAVARKFDGETRHQTALRYIKHAEDVAREAGKADAAMNRLDAEAKGVGK